MNKTHQIWQRFNLLAMGIVLGQTIRLPDSLTIGTLIGLALLASIILEARFNKRDVSGWRTGKLPPADLSG